MNTNKLRSLRKQSGMTQAQVATKLNISQSQYSDYETGKAQPPANMIRQIALLFNVSADYLLDLKG